MCCNSVVGRGWIYADRRLVNKDFQTSFLGRKPGLGENWAVKNYSRENQTPKTQKKEFVNLLGEREGLSPFSRLGERDPTVPVSSNQPENPAEAINPLKSSSLEKIWLTPPPQLGSRVKRIVVFWDSNKLGKQRSRRKKKQRGVGKYWIPVCTGWHYHYFVASHSSLRLCFPNLWM